MANISDERYAATEALYETWVRSDIYKEKFEGAASVISVLVAYLSDRYDLGIDSIPELTFAAERWLNGEDDGSYEA